MRGTRGCVAVTGRFSGETDVSAIGSSSDHGFNGGTALIENGGVLTSRSDGPGSTTSDENGSILNVLLV